MGRPQRKGYRDADSIVVDCSFGKDQRQRGQVILCPYGSGSSRTGIGASLPERTAVTASTQRFSGLVWLAARQLGYPRASAGSRYLSGPSLSKASRQQPQHPARPELECRGLEALKAGSSLSPRSPKSTYRIQQRRESDHFPQLIEIRNEWNRLPTSNIIISAPVTYDTKNLKWKGPGLDKVMEEVYRSAGTTKELKELLRVQELEAHPQGERVIAWRYLCDSLINTFSITKRLSISIIEPSPNGNEGKHALMTIDIETLINLIKKLKMEGAAGQNGIQNALFRGDPSFLAHYLALLFNDLQGTTGLPDEWKGSIIHPIYKVGNPANPSNYRLIALIDMEAKLYASCLLQQLAEWIHDRQFIPQCQTGFRADHLDPISVRRLKKDLMATEQC
ncbi:hypothetical protein NDU88_006397 [Pleurodeles waltl]|uniref:Reverse transcriptase domain-containing protein n=1 Tax=Pleurodeles waltl TaxID=8319 RepID=A0AAV7RNW1_PLEWA|nr:hypothetical protein NDU88_006397 [Pleurodeles waltl]